MAGPENDTILFLAAAEALARREATAVRAGRLA